jgi:hypothetical protein
MWFRDGAAQMKKPSIDRRDSADDYTFDNCVFIELRDNLQRSWANKGLRARAISAGMAARKKG